MQGKPRNAAGDDIGAGLNLSASRNPPPVELEHVLEAGLELRAIGGRQFGNPWHAIVTRRVILDLPVPRQNTLGHVAGEIDKIRIAQGAVVLKLTLRGA